MRVDEDHWARDWEIYVDGLCEILSNHKFLCVYLVHIQIVVFNDNLGWYSSLFNRIYIVGRGVRSVRILLARFIFGRPS